MATPSFLPNLATMTHTPLPLRAPHPPVPASMLHSPETPDTLSSSGPLLEADVQVNCRCVEIKYEAGGPLAGGSTWTSLHGKEPHLESTSDLAVTSGSELAHLPATTCSWMWSHT